MKRIDRLLQKARIDRRNLRRPTFALIRREGPLWGMTIHLWEGLAEHSEHDTTKDAVAQLAQQYPGEKIPVIVDDIPAV